MLQANEAQRGAYLAATVAWCLGDPCTGNTSQAKQAEREVAQACQGLRCRPFADLRAVLVPGSIADVVHLVLHRHHVDLARDAPEGVRAGRSLAPASQAAQGALRLVVPQTVA